MKNLFYFLSVFVVLFMSSCVNMDKISYEGVENVGVRDISMSGAGVDVELTVENTSSHNINILSGDFTINTKGRPFATLVLEDKVVIHRKSSTSVNFPITVRFRQGPLEMLAFKPADLNNATVSGSVTVKGGWAKKTFKLKDVNLSQFSGMLGTDNLNNMIFEGIR